MANKIKNYFLAPSWDYPPTSSVIALGNIIISPERPVPPLAVCPVPIVGLPGIQISDEEGQSNAPHNAPTHETESGGKLSQGPPTEVAQAAGLAAAAAYQNNDAQVHGYNETTGETASMISPPINTHKEDIEWTRERHSAGKFGIWTKFLQALGVGLDVSVESEMSRDDVFRFKRMHTMEIFPTDDFVRRAMAAPTVVSWFDRNSLNLARRSLYMIVGVKWVTGASVKTMAKKNNGGQVDVGFDVTAGTGIPISFGPSIEASRGIQDALSFEQSSDFIFAFRARKVKFGMTGKLQVTEYNQGAMYGADDEEKEEEGQLSQLLEIYGLEDEDVSVMA